MLQQPGRNIINDRSRKGSADALPPRSTAHRRIAAIEPVLPAEAGAHRNRARVLRAALELFAHRGYGGTSVRDICAAAHMQAPTLYAQFPSKEHVLAELIRLAYAELLRRLRAALLDCQPDPAQQLTALVRAHVIAHCEMAMLGVVASAELHMLSAGAAAPILVMVEQAEQLLIDIFTRGRRQGLFEVADEFLALRAIASLGVRVANWYTPACGRTPVQIADAYAGFAQRLLVAPLSGCAAPATPAARRSLRRGRSH
ncbi:MAG TPA: TetR/AcrR family transcriptional regulator [Nevskiaceae bacterium]|nr:TetR/AcrR family transcriptional regulator [Nevskiaceae bacterium]